MEINKIKKLQYNQLAVTTDSTPTTPPPSGGSGILNTILVSAFNGFDYPDNTPSSNLALPFKTLIRARNYLVANNLFNYTIKVLPGIYSISSGENMDYRGTWQFEDNTTINVRIGVSVREYLFTGSYPPNVIGYGKFVFTYLLGALYFPYSRNLPSGVFEAKAVDAPKNLLGSGIGGYLGGWCTFRNIVFTCTNGEANLFINKDVRSQVFQFENCQFINFYVDIENYAYLNFYKCRTYGFIGTPAINLGKATANDPIIYSCNFQECDFDMYSNGWGGILLKSTGVRMCVTRSRFNRGDTTKYAIKSDFDNTVAISAVSSSPIKGSGKLNNVIDKGFQYIDVSALPYLIAL
jgi:hypothetical protein